MRLKLFEGRQNWLEEGLLVLVKKNKRGRIREEGSSFAAQEEEEAAFQANVPPYRGIPMPPIYYGGVPMQAWGSVAAMPPPPPPMVPNVAFAEPYAHIPQP
jgi:hypothetical protein